MLAHTYDMTRKMKEKEEDEDDRGIYEKNIFQVKCGIFSVQKIKGATS